MSLTLYLISSGRIPRRLRRNLLASASPTSRPPSRGRGHRPLPELLRVASLAARGVAGGDEPLHPQEPQHYRPALSYRPQEVLTGGYGWPASRAGVASREPGPWSPWRSRRNGRPRSCARWRAASGTGGGAPACWRWPTRWTG